MHVHWDPVDAGLGETQGHCRRGRTGRGRSEIPEDGVLDEAGHAELLELLAVAMICTHQVVAGEEQIRSPFCNLCTEHSWKTAAALS